MSRLLAMFPGQGSQYIGMGRALLDDFPMAKLAFEEAEDSAKIKIRELCFEGPEEELKLTANTQPCILTVSVAVWRVLREETGIEPIAFAGHSLGEYSALVAADKLDLGKAAFLVRRRGEAMQSAVPVGVGAMAAVLKLPADELQKRIDPIHSDDNVVQIVNFNSPQQLVVAGHKKAVEQLSKVLEADGVNFVSLPVSAPFHSSLMKPARDEMTPLLEETSITQNDTKIIANISGKIEDSYDTSMVIRQIDNPVQWIKTMETAQEIETSGVVEVGPGRVLFGLARRALPRGTKLLHTEDLQKTISDINTL